MPANSLAGYSYSLSILLLIASTDVESLSMAAFNSSIMASICAGSKSKLVSRRATNSAFIERPVLAFASLSRSRMPGGIRRLYFGAGDASVGTALSGFCFMAAEYQFVSDVEMVSDMTLFLGDMADNARF